LVGAALPQLKAGWTRQGTLPELDRSGTWGWSLVLLQSEDSSPPVPRLFC
jgi:hypothetical protein